MKVKWAGVGAAPVEFCVWARAIDGSEEQTRLRDLRRTGHGRAARGFSVRRACWSPQLASGRTNSETPWNCCASRARILRWPSPTNGDSAISQRIAAKELPLSFPEVPYKQLNGDVHLTSMPIQIAVQSERIGIRLPAETKQRAEQAAAAAGWSLSDWLRTVIEIGATAE